MESKTILVVDDDASILKMFAGYFEGAGYVVRQEASGKQALKVLDEDVFDVVITDLLLEDLNGLEILRKVKSRASFTEVVIITGHSSVDSAVEAMKQGAFEYITKPVDLVELHIIVQKAIERQRLVTEVKYLRSQLHDFYHIDHIVATSPGMRKVLDIVKKISRSSSTVMIEGESGTGKEVIARVIHSHSLRSQGPFVAINCGALPENLLESELFGHVRGAFTGASTTKKGLFEEASGGTIFLDEVGETSPAFQVKLLRVLQESEIRRVGDTRDIAVDVRVLASSNTPIGSLVERGLFRQDLYYRLRVIPVVIPPLRDRREDITPLSRFFVERFCDKTGRPGVLIDESAKKKIEAYSWPGNVRELENAFERAMILLEGETIRAENILTDQNSGREDPGSAYDFYGMTLKEIEKLHIERVLSDSEWNQKAAARRLGIGYNTLWRKIKDYQIRKDQTASE